MSLCASCGLQLSGASGLCPHHHCIYGDDWHVQNRLMCDFFHRGKVPPRLSFAERDDAFWAHTAEVKLMGVPSPAERRLYRLLFVLLWREFRTTSDRDPRLLRMLRWAKRALPDRYRKALPKMES